MAGNPDNMLRRFTRLVKAGGRAPSGVEPASTQAQVTEFDKAEMKAMIERKRRNDYVRKRELDMLRHIRREGLSIDQASALTLQSSSHMDDSEMRSAPPSTHTQGTGLKAKIDAIERQMVGAASPPAAGPIRAVRTPPAVPPGPPPPLLTTTILEEDGGGHRNEDDAGTPTVQVGVVQEDGQEETGAAYRPRTRGNIPAGPKVAGTPPAGDVLAGGRPVGNMLTGNMSIASALAGTMEVREVVYDAALDEPVIAFAGGDFQGCEAALRDMVGPGGRQRQAEETWLVLFDLYRAIGQQEKFEALTTEYVELFHRSAPQWFSLPQKLALAQLSQPGPSPGHAAGGIGWICPARLDLEAVNRLDALSVQLPVPWVMDWSALLAVDAEAAGRLHQLMDRWATQPISMRWVAGERLLETLRDAAPTGVRDADPAYWMLRLEALRLAHRPDQFDEVAIDYCVTYEVSPPSWTNARCHAQLNDSGLNTRPLSLSVVGDVVTTFQDTSLSEEPVAPVCVASVELAGQLAGDLSELLGRLTLQIGQAQVVRIACPLLMRVDFIAAGDLLNWIGTCHREGREVVFHDTHRLVALMFGAMGITDLARVQLHQG